MHTGEKSHQCQICQKGFYKSSHITRHAKIHTGDKPLKCQLCEFKTKHDGHLKIHVRTHTGDKPYFCLVCQKTFSKNSGLKRHKKTTLKRSHFCVFFVTKHFPYLQRYEIMLESILE